MKSYLDETDYEILRLLQANGRITNADLAKKVDLSPPSVLQRVRALEKAGLIRGYFAHLDAERLGLKITAWVQISLSLHQEQAIERFRRAVSDLPEVQECYHVSGDSDFLLKVTVRDMKQYEGFIRERLARIKGVGKIQSSFVYATNKHSSQLPI